MACEPEITRAMDCLSQVNKVFRDALQLLEEGTQTTFDAPPLKWQSFKIAGYYYAALLTEKQLYRLTEPDLSHPECRAWEVVHEAQLAGLAAGTAFIQATISAQAGDIREWLEHIKGHGKYVMGKCWDNAGHCYECSDTTCAQEHPGYQFLANAKCPIHDGKDKASEDSPAPAAGAKGVEEKARRK